MFITLEGIDGAGKSTQAEAIGNWLRWRNIPRVITREPGSRSDRVCEAIRRATKMDGLDDTAAMLLYLADRAQHISKVIKPALDRGDWVVSDRFSDSTLVYQPPSCQRLMYEIIPAIGTTAIPDLTLLLDVSPKVAADRCMIRDAKPADVGELVSLRRRYLSVVERDIDRWRIIDGEGTPEDVTERIEAVLSKLNVRRGLTK